MRSVIIGYSTPVKSKLLRGMTFISVKSVLGPLRRLELREEMHCRSTERDVFVIAVSTLL